jgi:hypothetical protein
MARGGATTVHGEGARGGTAHTAQLAHSGVQATDHEEDQDPRRTVSVGKA